MSRPMPEEIKAAKKSIQNTLNDITRRYESIYYKGDPDGVKAKIANNRSSSKELYEIEKSLSHMVGHVAIIRESNANIEQDLKLIFSIVRKAYLEEQKTGGTVNSELELVERFNRAKEIIDDLVPKVKRYEELWTQLRPGNVVSGDAIQGETVDPHTREFMEEQRRIRAECDEMRPGIVDDYYRLIQILMALRKNVEELEMEEGNVLTEEREVSEESQRIYNICKDIVKNINKIKKE